MIIAGEAGFPGCGRLNSQQTANRQVGARNVTFQKILGFWKFYASATPLSTSMEDLPVLRVLVSLPLVLFFSFSFEELTISSLP